MRSYLDRSQFEQQGSKYFPVFAVVGFDGYVPQTYIGCRGPEAAEQLREVLKAQFTLLAPRLDDLRPALSQNFIQKFGVSEQCLVSVTGQAQKVVEVLRQLVQPNGQPYLSPQLADEVEHGAETTAGHVTTYNGAAGEQVPLFDRLRRIAALF